mgnify:CR=1 FL=1
MQGELSEEDAAVVGDDFMWYRAMAYEQLEKLGVPVTTITGRRPLSFIVDGVARSFDLSSQTTLDVVVLYDTNREPLIIAPIDIEQADEYYK